MRGEWPHVRRGVSKGEESMLLLGWSRVAAVAILFGVVHS